MDYLSVHRENGPAMARDPNNVILGNRIRELRLKAGMSQEALAEAANLHRNMIGLLERGQRSASLQTMVKVAKALKVRPKQLLWKF